MKEDDNTSKIIGCAKKFTKHLGPGLLERRPMKFALDTPELRNQGLDTWSLKFLCQSFLKG